VGEYVTRFVPRVPLVRFLRFGEVYLEAGFRRGMAYAGNEAVLVSRADTQLRREF
jgi:hypothetical protein